MNLMLLLGAGCALSAAAAISAAIVWFLSSRNKANEGSDDDGMPADPAASRGPMVVLPGSDNISESEIASGPALAPRPAPLPAAPPPMAREPAAPQISFRPPPQPVAVPPPMAPPPAAVPPSAPRPSAQAMPRPAVAPGAPRNIVERVAPAPAPAPPAPAPVAKAAPPASVPPPAPKPPPGVPAGVTIVPNDLTPFGMQNQPRGPAVRTKATPGAAPSPTSDKKKDGKA